MSTTQHTPLPWDYDPNHMVIFQADNRYADNAAIGPGGIWQGLSDNQLGEICTITEHDVHTFSIGDITYRRDRNVCKRARQRDAANAAFIVRACNAHDDLLEVVRMVAGMRPGESISEAKQDWARAAIRKAEGGA
jgi:hypothetical protein